MTLKYPFQLVSFFVGGVRQGFPFAFPQKIWSCSSTPFLALTLATSSAVFRSAKTSPFTFRCLTMSVSYQIPHWVTFLSFCISIRVRFTADSALKISHPIDPFLDLAIYENAIFMTLTQFADRKVSFTNCPTIFTSFLIGIICGCCSNCFHLFGFSQFLCTVR